MENGTVLVNIYRYISVYFSLQSCLCFKNNNGFTISPCLHLYFLRFINEKENMIYTEMKVAIL